jgi:hypothetical protein
LDLTIKYSVHATQNRLGIALGGLLYICIELEPMR